MRPVNGLGGRLDNRGSRPREQVDCRLALGPQVEELGRYGVDGSFIDIVQVSTWAHGRDDVTRPTHAEAILVSQVLVHHLDGVLAHAHHGPCICSNGGEANRAPILLHGSN